MFERAQLHSIWKLNNELKRLLVLPINRFLFMISGIRWRSDWKLYGIPIVQKNRQSTLKIGSGLQLRSSPRSNPLAPHHPVVLCTMTAQAQLEIGHSFGMTGGSVVCADQIIIGDRVAVGANSVIADTDFHPISAMERQINPSDGAHAPIIIEDDVFIGTQTLILKGVSVGAGSVIGAGSVVTSSIPAGVIAAGNPAKIIRPVGDDAEL